MTKVLSLLLALVFVGVFADFAEAGRCDPQRSASGVTVFPFCRENPRIGIRVEIPRGYSRHRHYRGCGHGHPMYRPMPVVQGPQCRPCIPGFARVPMPGKPCWCEPMQ